MFALRLLIFVVLISYMYSQIINSDTYGPFKARWRYYDLCSGPKRDNLTFVTKSLLVENDVYIGILNVTFPANVRVDEIKMTVTTSNRTNTKPITWSYRIQKPCQHYSISWIFNEQLNASDCVIKKGFYNLVINFSEAVQKFFAGRFFYGEYLFKVVGVSSKGNIICMIFNPIFSKP